MNNAEGLGLWQYALKFRLLTMAISSMTVFVVAILDYTPRSAITGLQIGAREFAKE
jgi:hypothetical protein